MVRVPTRRILSVLLLVCAVCMIAVNIVNLQSKPHGYFNDLSELDDAQTDRVEQTKLSRQVFEVKHKAGEDRGGGGLGVPASGWSGAVSDAGEVASSDHSSLQTHSVNSALRLADSLRVSNGTERRTHNSALQHISQLQIKSLGSLQEAIRRKQTLGASHLEGVSQTPRTDSTHTSHSSASDVPSNLILNSTNMPVIHAYNQPRFFSKTLKRNQRRQYAKYEYLNRHRHYSDKHFNLTQLNVKTLSEKDVPYLENSSSKGNGHVVNASYPIFQWNKKRKRSHLWPDPLQPHKDRVMEQLQFVSPEAVRDTKFGINKIILTFSGSSGLPEGREKFSKDKCPVDSCYLTWDVRWAQKADVVIFNFDPGPDTWDKPDHQVWLLSLLESPLNTPTLYGLNNKINWTASYRSDSTIVTPYEKYVPYETRTVNTKSQYLADNVQSFPVKTNYAEGKTKLVAWFVSNCNARNKRMSYVRELQKHIQVDIYGACGPNKCSKVNQDKCFNLLEQHYKFYLAFENSNCQYYITEKFFTNALKSGVVPVVIGARKEDYEAVAPPRSFIHVEDFASPTQLASFLIALDKDDSLYNEYFHWRQTGGFIDTKFWCRLCALLHQDDFPHTWYSDVEKWWRGDGTCTHDRWDSPSHLISQWTDLIF